MIKQCLLMVGLFGCGASLAKEVTYYYTDPQGNVLAETDEHGNIKKTSDYRPFGSPIAGDVPSIGYSGHVMDAEDNLIYMKARYYDPDSGRFLSRDPMPVRPGALSSFSRFAYVGDNPLTFSDPTGMYICTGDGKNCDKVASALVLIGQASKGFPAGSSGRARLESIASFYGKPGEANGVKVQFADLGKSANANTVTQGGDTAITIDMAKMGSSLSTRVPESQDAEIAATVAHEGSHGITQRSSIPSTRDQVLSDEKNAFRTQGSVNQGLGISSIYGIWVQGDSSLNEDAVSTYADKSTENWCNAGGKC